MDYAANAKTMVFKNDIEVAYTDTLKGEKILVFIHGLASNLSIWEKNIQALQRFYRCIAIDLPGHGVSSKGNYKYNIGFYTRILSEWLKRLRLPSPPVLIGHSMGGQIAVNLQHQMPDFFSELVLVSPAGFETFSLHEQMFLNQMSSNQMIPTTQYFKMMLSIKNYFYKLNPKEEAKLNALNEDFFSEKENAYLKKILTRSMSGMMQQNIYEWLGEIETRTLVFFGKNDNLIPNSFVHPFFTPEMIAKSGTEKLKNARLVLYDNCGHFLQYEHYRKFNVDLYKFLNASVFEEL